METLRLEPVQSMQITTLIDNTTDLTIGGNENVERKSFPHLPRPDSPVFESPGFDAFIAEHGFSALVEVDTGRRQVQVLFDAGLSPTGLIGNLDRLERDPSEIEVIVLSHGHFDHTGGLDGIIDRIGQVNLPVVIHPEFWNRRRIVLPGRDPLEIPTTSRTALEGAGFDIVEDRAPSFLMDRSVLITGEIDRTTDYEHGLPGQEVHRAGEWIAEPETLDDQAMVVHVEGKGLVIISGCGHSGIINTVHHAQRLTGVNEIHAIVGGFHLGPPAFHSIIDVTVDELVNLSPNVIVPAHCTGFKAQTQFAQRLPEAFVPNAVGTTFHL